VAPAERSAPAGRVVRASGVSNSRFDFTFCNRSGFDTIALTWPDQGGTELLSHLQASDATVPFARGVLALDRLAGGGRITAWPEHGVVKFEGRLAALVDGDAGSHRLADRGDMLRADVAARAQVAELLGAAPQGDTVAVSRYDLAAEFDFDQGDDGRTLLAAMRAVVPAAYKAKIFQRSASAVESVTTVTARRGAVAFRAYDKGLESGTAAPGHRVRFEAQIRHKGASRREPVELARRDLRADFGRTLRSMLEAQDATVTGTSASVDVLVGKVAAGELTMARAERLIGSLEVLRRFGRAVYGDDLASWRRLAALREAGIAVDDQLPPDAVVPVGELLRRAVEEFAA
jgi:hypothetical protein